MITSFFNEEKRSQLVQGGNLFSTEKKSYKHSIIFTKTIKSDHDKGRVRHSFLNDSQFLIKKSRERIFFRYSETFIDPLLYLKELKLKFSSPFFFGIKRMATHFKFLEQR